MSKKIKKVSVAVMAGLFSLFLAVGVTNSSLNLVHHVNAEDEDENGEENEEVTSPVSTGTVGSNADSSPVSENPDGESTDGEGSVSAAPAVEEPVSEDPAVEEPVREEGAAAPVDFSAATVETTMYPEMFLPKKVDKMEDSMKDKPMMDEHSMSDNGMAKDHVPTTDAKTSAVALVATLAASFAALTKKR